MSGTSTCTQSRDRNRDCVPQDAVVTVHSPLPASGKSPWPGPGRVSHLYQPERTPLGSTGNCVTSRAFPGTDGDLRWLAALHPRMVRRRSGSAAAINRYDSVRYAPARRSFRSRRSNRSLVPVICPICALCARIIRGSRGARWTEVTDGPTGLAHCLARDLRPGRGYCRRWPIARDIVPSGRHHKPHASVSPPGCEFTPIGTILVRFPTPGASNS